MHPIYKEYIQFLKDNEFKLDLKDGYYWIDNLIIKAYDKNGNLHKIARIYINDDLQMNFKYYENKNFNIESWQDTVYRNLDRLKQLEEQSTNIIVNSLNKYKTYTPIILFSGGKDSSVTAFLVRNVDNNIKMIFNNTTLDCADTYKFIKAINNIEIINPKEGFYQWREKNNFIPTRFSRACCSIFKEDALLNKLDRNEKYLFFMGMRNDESNTRSQYDYEWKNEKWGKRNWQGILAIKNWTEIDIWLYILWKNISINNKYKKGYSRVGCAIACPFYSKSTWILDKYWYPIMYKRWHNILEKDFIDNYKWTVLNCTLKEYHTCWNGGLLREKPTEEVINEFAEYKGLDIEIAKKYFNHTCKFCNKSVNKKDEIAMNLKLLGRNIDTYLCKKHLMEYLELDKEKWDRYIKEFKESGCSLF